MPIKVSEEHAAYDIINKSNERDRKLILVKIKRKNKKKLKN